MISLDTMRYFVRITSCYGLKNGHYQFSGRFVRRESYAHFVSAASIARIHVSETHLNQEPAVGQVWQITGPASKSEVETRTGYVLTQYYFDAPQAVMVMPETFEEFVRFVGTHQDFKGIGETTARKLFEALGERLFDLLRAGDVRPLLGLLSEARAQSLLAGFRKYENLDHALEFARLGIPPSIQSKLFAYHHSEAYQQIKDNPYLLQHFGMSFEKTDALARKQFHLTEYDPNRLNAMVECAMRQHCKAGHTVATVAQIWKRVLPLAGGDEALTEAAIMNAHNSLGIYYQKDTQTLHHTGLYIMERTIAKRLLALLHDPREAWGVGSDEAYASAVANLPFRLNHEQGDAIISSLAARVFCLTGGAGTGKTTVLRAIVEAYQSLRYQVYGVALSGRAAKRLHESIQIETKTIQRFLMLSDETLSASERILLVIDEASMVDIPSLYKLLMKLPKVSEVRVIFAGDDEQLPPIGAGLVLSELIQSGVIPRVHLAKVRRQANHTGIPGYAAQIRQGQVPKSLSDKNIRFSHCELDEMVERIVALYRELNGEVQIITPTRKLTAELNAQCQAECNPYGKKLIVTNALGEDEDLGFRLGDPVIFTKNDYKLDVQNGTLGRVMQLFDDSDSKVLAKVEIDTGRMVDVTYSMIDDMDLAYAITLHKAQGSQFETVIAPIIINPVLVDKSWVYTATTRATTNMYWLGSAEAFASAIHAGNKASRRQVYLSHLLVNDTNAEPQTALVSPPQAV
ncbi:AAA family ATPase [Vibrio alfacsensis]|uniref:AAA family ATPase n=2 Tax=Vibrio alfacsensis TaxID=1074311 RepID=UPI0040687A2B